MLAALVVEPPRDLNHIRRRDVLHFERFRHLSPAHDIGELNHHLLFRQVEMFVEERQTVFRLSAMPPEHLTHLREDYVVLREAPVDVIDVPKTVYILGKADRAHAYYSQK
jgi:hypothetical protein